MSEQLDMTEIEIRDYMYNDIKLSYLEKEIINSEQFQRLRRLYQIPITQYIYPNATHTRFSQSIGTMNVATEIFDNIPELQSMKDDHKNKYELTRKYTRLSALLYDVHDPPFYQVFNEDSKHKSIISNVLTELRKNTITDIFQNIPKEKREDISHEKIIDILESPPKEYKFIPQIIDSEVGANRIDYLNRDSYFCGIHYGKVDSRILSMFRLNKDNNLVLSREAIPLVDSIFHSLFSMRYNVYDHKVSRIIVRMLYETYSSLIKTKKRKKEDIIKELVMCDDRQFMDKLISFEKTNKKPKYATRIFTKRDLLKTAYVLEAPALKDIQLVLPLNDMKDKRDELEKDIKSKEKIDVLLDFAPISTPSTAPLNVRINGEEALLSSSPLLREWYDKRGNLGFGSKALTRWKMVVISEKEEQEKATNFSKTLFEPFLIGHDKGKKPVSIQIVQEMYKHLDTIDSKEPIDNYTPKIVSLTGARRKRLLEIYKAEKPVTAKDLSLKTGKSLSIENIYLDYLFENGLLDRERSGHAYQYLPKLQTRKALDRLNIN